jgi:hypothetical protein
MTAPETKACEQCGGDGCCPMCEGDGFIECCCDCGDWHTKDCEECDATGKCVACRGDGDERLTDREREAAGQLSALVEAPNGA